MDYLKTGGYRMWIADKYIDHVKEPCKRTDNGTSRGKLGKDASWI